MSMHSPLPPHILPPHILPPHILSPHDPFALELKPQLDPTPAPPFRGFIATTYDALLIFEAAIRGMVPRVTRRLMESERVMIQSGSVFVFAEHESGIRRWTDGYAWSPSRILGNFLIYRELDNKRSQNRSSASSGRPPSSTDRTSPSSSSSRARIRAAQSQSESHAESSHMAMMRSPHETGPIGYGNDNPPPAMGSGALRSRRASDPGAQIDPARERALVGSLTSSDLYKEKGLIKRTMSVTYEGGTQHLISYYTLDDIVSGRLRTPSTIPELASLEINQDILQRQNFRHPPMLEVGPDGLVRYRGETEEASLPQTPASAVSQSFQTMMPEIYDPYGPPQPSFHLDSPHAGTSNRYRPSNGPVPIPNPGSANQQGYFQSPTEYSGYINHAHSGMTQPGTSASAALVRQRSSSGIPASRSIVTQRPASSSSRRFEPYQSSPRPSTAHPRMGMSMGTLPYHQAPDRRPSVISPGLTPHSEYDYQPPSTGNSEYDLRPPSSANPYHYQPPATAPSMFADYYPSPHHQSHAMHSPLQSPVFAPQAVPPQSYQAWQTPSSGRLMPVATPRAGMGDYGPPAPGSAGSSASSGHGGQHVHHAQQQVPSVYGSGTGSSTSWGDQGGVHGQWDGGYVGVPGGALQE